MYYIYNILPYSEASVDDRTNTHSGSQRVTRDESTRQLAFFSLTVLQMLLAWHYIYSIAHMYRTKKYRV